jgi:hypothetical protein
VRQSAGLAVFALLIARPATLWAGAQITIVNSDAAGVGLNDTTSVTPVGGNAGTTLGQQRLNALQQVASIWGALLDSPVEIRVQVRFQDLPCTPTSVTLAQSGPIQAASDFIPGAGFPGPEFPATWYAIALANRRAGRDLIPGNPNSDDISTEINSKIGQSGCSFGFYYGFDRQFGSNVDFISTLLHEFGHGFGFLTFVSLTTGAELTGANPGTGVIQSQPDVFERNILDESAGKLWTDMTNAERAASAINTGKVVWAGPAVTASAPGVLHGTPTLEVSAPVSVAGKYAVGLASFGPSPTDAGVAGQLVAALDPADPNGTSMFDACSSLTTASAVAGKVALVDRGTCTFVIKTKNAQAAGAIAIIIANNVDGNLPPGLGGSDPTITIPAVSITKADGAALRAALDAGVTVKLYLDATRLAGTDPSGRVLLYAPNPIQRGSSISHWDSSAFPDLLMEPSISSDGTHDVDLTLPALRDIGWYPDLVARDPVAPARRTHTAHAQAPRP